MKGIQAITAQVTSRSFAKTCSCFIVLYVHHVPVSVIVLIFTPNAIEATRKSCVKKQHLISMSIIRLLFMRALVNRLVHSRWTPPDSPTSPLPSLENNAFALI